MTDIRERCNVNVSDLNLFIISFRNAGWLLRYVCGPTLARSLISMFVSQDEAKIRE